jgi:two-component system sensor histidine kinase KdpD
MFSRPSAVCVKQDGGPIPCEAAGTAEGDDGERDASRNASRIVRLQFEATDPDGVTFVVHPPIDENGRALLHALARQVGLALERVRLSRAARDATLRVRAEEARNSLLSAVSHDLRTPLATITGAATTLLGSGGRLSEVERTDLVEAVCTEAGRMDRLIANVLDMARIGAGGMALSQEWVPLEEVVGVALEHLDAKLGACDVRLSFPADLPDAWIDSVLFEHLLVNLIENAVDHASPMGPIDISGRRTSDALEVCVADRGPGLPGGDRERLFERFTRGPRSRGSGVGLGLAICRAIARAHSGDVLAEDREGGGAVFRVVLPLRGDVENVAEVCVDVEVGEGDGRG